MQTDGAAGDIFLKNPEPSENPVVEKALLEKRPSPERVSVLEVLVRSRGLSWGCPAWGPAGARL